MDFFRQIIYHMKSEVRYMVIELDSQYEKRKQEIEKIVKNVAT